MDVPPRAKTAAKVAVVAAVVLVVVFGGLVATGVLAPPTVEHIDKGWGEVTDDTTRIETQVQVDNPNPVGIPGILSVTYRASLNDVVLTEHRESGIGLGPGTNTISLSSAMPNDRIADWWVTHVNNDERSTLTIEPAVSGPGFSRSLPARNSTIETDLLSSFASSGPETLTLDDESFLVLENQSAAWGTATAETTPLTFTTTLRNVHDYGVTLDGVEYVVNMNSVTLGSGRTTEDVDVAPGESGTLRVEATLDTEAFGDWWPTHVRNDETSRMSVELYGIVERNGTRSRVPLRLYQQRLAFDTDLLGDGGTTVEALPTERDSLTVPQVAETDSEWGTITDSAAEIRTRIELTDTSDLSKLRNVTTLTVDRTTTIGDVTVVDSTTSRGLPAAGEPLTVTSEMDTTTFADWWTRHVNGGETSTVSTRATALVDVGITAFARPLADRQSTFETDLLGSVGADGPRTVTAGNETLVVVGGQAATWGTATDETTPFTVSTSLDNRHEEPITFAGVAYNVTMNDVVVANGSTDQSLAVDPGEQAPLDVTVPMSTPKLSTWWRSHLRGEETSTVSVRLYGVVERDGSRERVPIALAEDRFELTTDLLGEDASTTEPLAVERPEIEQPTVENTTRRWGEVTDATTDVVADITVDNPTTDPELTDFVRLGMTTETVINDVVFGSGERSGLTLQAGINDVELTTVLDNERVPTWWARHLNAGETSSVTTTTTTTVDVGFTTLSVPTPSTNATVETALLASLNTDDAQPIEHDGRTYLVAERTEAEWGTATPEVAPLDARSVLRNEQPAPVTVRSIDYTVSLNGIVLADDSHLEGTIIAAGETETVHVPMELDNSKMDAWWVSHVRNDETSTLDVDATATISVAGQTRTVPLEMFSKNDTVETDFLGGEN